MSFIGGSGLVFYLFLFFVFMSLEIILVTTEIVREYNSIGFRNKSCDFSTEIVAENILFIFYLDSIFMII